MLNNWKGYLFERLNKVASVFNFPILLAKCITNSQVNNIYTFYNWFRLNLMVINYSIFVSICPLCSYIYIIYFNLFAYGLIHLCLNDWPNQQHNIQRIYLTWLPAVCRVYRFPNCASVRTRIQLSMAIISYVHICPAPSASNHPLAQSRTLTNNFVNLLLLCVP